MNDYTDHLKDQGRRRQLCIQLKEKGIIDPLVLKAIEKVPRHWFLDSVFYDKAYTDMAFKIGAGQTISHPSTVGFQSQLLMVEKGEKVLEIGTGSGYQTAILCELGAKVFSVERQKALYDRTRIALPAMGYQAKLFYGDGYQGLPTFAPFNKIIVTAGAPFIPPALVEQLKPGGIMVIPVGEGEKQEMLSLVKDPFGKVETYKYGDFKFVPLLEEKSH